MTVQQQRRPVGRTDITDAPHFVFVEDFPCGLVGPFENRPLADAHVLKHRYGSSHYEVISHVIAKHLEGHMDFHLTPEEDVAAKKEIPEEDR